MSAGDSAQARTRHAQPAVDVSAEQGGPTVQEVAGPGALTVLYDAGCGLCRTARRWVESRPRLVPLRWVAAGSDEARARFPGLDHDATLRDITVVADTGKVYVGDGAWLACLWALAGYRELSVRLSQPHLRPVARRVVAAAAAVREKTRYGEPDEREECAEDRCG